MTQLGKTIDEFNNIKESVWLLGTTEVYILEEIALILLDSFIKTTSVKHCYP